MHSSRTTLETKCLADVVARPDYAVRVIDAIGHIADAPNEASALECLYEAKTRMGADHAVFVSFIRECDSRESFRFMLACQSAWCMQYQRAHWYGSDAWFLYATTNSSPVCGSKIALRTRGQREANELAARFGFVSTYVVPAPSSSGLSRLGVLILGAEQPGYFEGQGEGALKVVARSLAMELHEWWVRQARMEIVAKARLTASDLALLVAERSGRGTKEIADELGMTVCAVDCRFQRLNAKFNTPNRRATARVAAEYGLI